MRPRTFQIRLDRLRGVPGVLILVLGAIVVAVVVGLVLVLGVFVAGAGLVLSAGAALYFGMKRFLAKGMPERPKWVESKPSSSAASPTREIEVEVLSETRIR